jgi:menaquinone-dependent protoporphyrinogen oxidase
VFGGKLERDALSLRERALVRMVKAPYGDFRDWTAITAWAEQVALELSELAAGDAAREPAAVR